METDPESYPLQDPISELLTTYNELNSSIITELFSVPSALEFMRFVAQNRPFVVRKGASDWEATRTWNLSTLKTLLEGQKVNVAVTPEGNADSPTRNDDGEVVFVKPWEELQDFDEFVDFVARQEKQGRKPGEEVRYAQTQNDNLRNEYSTLFTHVSPSPTFAEEALQQVPDAINLWIGNSSSVTALHKDNYENIYVQIIGQKHFVLLPPVAYPCVQENNLRPAVYVRSQGSENDCKDQGLKIVMEESIKIPFATWDPDDVGTEQEENDTEERKYSRLVKPTRVTLNKGDILYLPALWYHKVSQSCSEEGICCAVNYWYDMEFGGSFYPLCNFVRSISLASSTR